MIRLILAAAGGFAAGHIAGKYAERDVAIFATAAGAFITWKVLA